MHVIHYLEVKLQDVMEEAFLVFLAKEGRKDMLGDGDVVLIMQGDPCGDDYVEIPLQNFF